MSTCWATGRSTGLRLLSLFTLSFVAGWTAGRSTGLHFLVSALDTFFFQLWSRDWPASGIETWQGSGFRTCLSGHFLLVDLVRPSCARIRGLTTSAVYGVDLNFRPLSPIRGFCIGLWMHQLVIEKCWIIWYWVSLPPRCDPSSPPVPPINFLGRHSPPRHRRAKWIPLAELYVLSRAP